MASWSVITILRQLFLEATAAAPAADSMADRIIGLSAAAPPAPTAISTLSSYSIGTQLAAAGMAVWGNGASASNFGANRAVLIPFYFPKAITIVKMAIENGGTVSGNVDVGIYDASFARKVSSGSTAQGAINTFQAFDIADTALSALTLYYMALAADNGTGLFTAFSATLGSAFGLARSGAVALGLFSAAASFPLPANISVDATFGPSGCPLISVSSNTSI